MAGVKFDWPKALGEFVIIVVGVLAALGVDEWRGVQEDRALEASYMARLRADIKQDQATFAEDAAVMEQKAQFLQSLIEKSAAQQFKDKPLEVMRSKVTSSFRGAPAVARSTFDELLSTGRLALIRDVSVRTAISKYYADYASFNAQVNAISPGNYPILVNGLVPGSVAREWRLSNTISQPDVFLRSLMELQEHPQLRAAANNEISYASALQFYFGRHAQRGKELLLLLERTKD